MSTSIRSPAQVAAAAAGPYKPVVIIHGGAGAITRSALPPELYHRYHTSLLTYLTSTKTLLLSSASAVDAACHAVSLLEDDPLFNCGRGSVFTTAGHIEMEASIAVSSIDDSTLEYEGKVKRSAAVSMIRQTRHPILLARAVLNMADDDKDIKTASMHGHLSGPGVERWGWETQGLEQKNPSWFWTRKRWEEHQRGLKLQQAANDGDDGLLEEDDDHHPLPSQGTVGAVCMDSWGVIAAATSTGGLTNKLPGRIGDTPTVGAGFWAESWTEEEEEEDSVSLPMAETTTAATASPVVSFSERLATRAKAEMEFWFGDCLGTPGENNTFRDDEKDRLLLINNGNKHMSSTRPTHQRQQRPIKSKKLRHAVGMSGTGNGDSFLRVNACRTAAAMSRFSRCSSLSLAEAINRVAGPGGELQRSAGKRWDLNTGEGQGGIIGIELTTTTTTITSSTNETGQQGGKEEEEPEGKAVFGFNCGGMWRAYFDRTPDGKEVPKVMVFREEYH